MHCTLTRLAALAFAVAATQASAYFETYPGCGAQPWSQTRSTALAPNGDVVVTGCLHPSFTYDSMLTIRYNAVTGDIVWSNRYNGTGPGSDAAAAVAIDGVGDVVVTGSSVDGASGRRNMRTIKYQGTTGSQLWSSAYLAQGTSRAYAVAVSMGGHVFVTGESEDPNRIIRTVKYDGATGTQLWAAAFAGSYAGGFNYGYAVVVDSSGDAYVTGLGAENTFGSNFRTIKYDGATGAVLWTRDLGVYGDDSGLAAALDPSGNLVVVGYTYDATIGSQWRAVKYASATGNTIWNTVVSGSPASGDTPSALAVDAAGNVFVTGFMDGGGYNIHTVKLEAATGAVQWNRSYNGAANGDDFGNAIAVDANGDVIVTGSSEDGALDYTTRTIKYRGTDGTELWNQGVVGGGGGRGVVVDATGHAMVSGHAFDATTRGYAFRVWKYTGSTGTPAWTSADPLLPAESDFNDDAKPDLLWASTRSGAHYAWHMDGTRLVSDAFVTQIDPAWKVQAIADFNGDNKVDIVWRNTATGDTYVWYMDGTRFVGDAFLFSLPPQWAIQGVADFNADGKPDFLMRNTDTGVAFAWFFSNAMPVSDQFLFGIDARWKVEAVGDVNGDGQPDLVFRNMDSGLAFAWYTYYGSGGLMLTTASDPIFSIDPAWEIAQLADWNGDGQRDLLFRNRDTGLVFVWYMTGTTLGASEYVNQIDPSWEIVPRR